MATKKKALTDIPTAPTVPVIDQGEFAIIPLNKIRISDTNRKRFDPIKLNELAASIKEIGVAQPILVRPVYPTDYEPETYEIVAGERRFRASVIADMTAIPAMIRQLSDLQAAKIQILENLQREDPHPLEEAEGYENLMLCHGYTADLLVRELKKSRSYIYTRLKLCALAKDLRSEFLNNKFSSSVAVLIARIPVPELQIKAMKEITEPNYMGDIPSYRAAKEILQRRYMLDLDDALFDIKDSKLLASAGNCTNCPKRTGNQPEIFSDIDANICTDPDCFAQKNTALNHRKIADANKKGIPVIEGDDAKNYTKGAQHNGEVKLSNMAWSFDRVNESSKNKSVRQLIDQSDLPTPACILVMPDGDVIELFNTATLQTLLEKAGHALTEEQEADAKEKAEKPSALPTDAYLKKQEQDRILKERADHENEFRHHLYSQFRAKALLEPDAPINVMISALARVLIPEYSRPYEQLGSYYTNRLNTVADANTHIDQHPEQALQYAFDALIGNAIDAHMWTIDDRLDDNDAWSLLLKFSRAAGIDPESARAEFENPVDATPFKRPLISLKKPTTDAA